jgi:hypothetical protein
MEDLAFLMFPGTSSISEIRTCSLLFLLYIYSKYKELSLCGIELKSQPVKIGFVTVETVAGNIYSLLFI